MLLSIIAAGAMAMGGSDEQMSAPTTWLRQPTKTQIAAAFPDAAARLEVHGTAAIHCRVDDRGSMRNCALQREDPDGYGFGLAALSLAADYRMKPPTLASGEAAYVVIPIHFDRKVLAERGRLSTDGPVVQSPTWSSAPSFADVAAAYPARAGGVDGSATISCRFGADGRLTPCAVAQETPAGLGFGDAAKSLAAKFVVHVDPFWAMGDERFGVEVPVQFISPDKADMRERHIGQPVWTTALSPTAVSTFFPAEASAKGVTTGRGVAECKVQADGGLTDCRPIAAEPEGLGFSEAAARAAAGMRMSPWTQDGGPVDGATIRVPIRLTVEEPSAEEAATRVVFLDTPNSDDIMRAFPQRALVRNVTGQVDLRCKVRNSGEVEQCAVASETPGGWGFGSAAQMLAPKFKVAMESRDHPKAGAWIIVPVSLATMSH